MYQIFDRTIFKNILFQQNKLSDLKKKRYNKKTIKKPGGLSYTYNSTSDQFASNYIPMYILYQHRKEKNTFENMNLHLDAKNISLHSITE